MFKFKQFNVDQSSCAMKINTDGVLLGAIATSNDPHNILDIGTGTGVIALMLSQKFHDAKIDAVEIDMDASQTAERNFKGSSFAGRLTIYPQDFESYFDQFPEKKYDLIVSNPPFYILSLKSPKANKTLAKHTDVEFFEKLINKVSKHLVSSGCCWLILPITLMDMIATLIHKHNLYLQKVVNVYSYPHSEAHRVIICAGFEKVLTETSNFTIYEVAGVYSGQYKALLQPFFLNF